MADVSVTHNFADATPAEADEVDQNFSDIVTWVNANAIRADASIPFTGVPSGPSTNPSTANQFTRKGYVDDYAIPTYQSQEDQIDIQTQPVAENQLTWGGGSCVIIPDPGYNFSVTGQGFVTFTPSTTNNPLNIWSMKVKVNGTIQSVFHIPIVGATQSAPFVLPITNVTPSGNTTIQLFTQNESATGYTLDVDSTSTTRCFFVAQWWRR